MKTLLVTLFVLGLVFSLFFSSPYSLTPISLIHADELEDIAKKIEELTRAREMSISATIPLESQLVNLERQISSITQRLDNVQKQIEVKEKELTILEAAIKKSESELSFQQELFAKTVRDFYIRSRLNLPILAIFTSSNLAQITRELAYRNAVAQQDKEVIVTLSAKIAELKNNKEKARVLKEGLSQEKTKLANLRLKVDKEAEFLRKTVTEARAYQASLTIEIAKLTARQQEILAARSGNFIVSVGDVELADDYFASIKGFRESAPAGSFAVFSFGAYTHRKGMSQYGARGRALAGQDYRTILREYYGKEPVVKDTSGTINVLGFGALDFETTYLYGIAEMPSSWPPEALKAQAVAARTYAYRYKQNGQAICPTEDCQVFLRTKADNPPSSWKEAVDQTRGQVLEDVITYYSSTAGGYLVTYGWDTTDKQGGANFIDRAYEKHGGSPWLYKAWYTKGYSPSSDKCGRTNPWLNSEEMADIVNAALILTNGTASEKERITPVTVTCWGGNPYSMAELRSVAAKYGGISSVNSFVVEQGTGTTSRVIVNGISLSGTTFKQAFNLRAPGFLMIPQAGFAFFNIERK